MSFFHISFRKKEPHVLIMAKPRKTRKIYYFVSLAAKPRKTYKKYYLVSLVAKPQITHKKYFTQTCEKSFIHPPDNIYGKKYII